MFDEVHEDSAVTFRIELSLYTAVAVNSSSVPALIVGDAGGTDSRTSVVGAALTARFAVPETVPKVAPMPVVPVERPVARPFTGIATTEVFVDVHAAWLVRSWADPSE